MGLIRTELPLGRPGHSRPAGLSQIPRQTLAAPPNLAGVGLELQIGIQFTFLALLSLSLADSAIDERLRGEICVF